MIEDINELHAVLSPKSFKETVCPDLFRLRRYYQKKRQRRSFGKFVYYLKRQGYLKDKKIKNQNALIITSKGIRKILKTAVKIKMLSKREDGKLQMIMYDIPEDKKQDRERFRDALKALGYSKLQKSIWVSPYDVFKETQRLVSDYDFSDYIRLFLVEEKAIE